MSSLLLILLSAVLVSVVVIEHVPAWRPFVGIVGTFENVRGIAQTLLFALPLTTALSYALSKLVLIPLGLGYLHTFATFAVVIAVASAAEPLMRTVARVVPARPGFSLLVMANCALPGVAFVADERTRGLDDAILVGIVSAIACGAMLLAFAALYERLRHADVPRAFRNAPLAFVSAGIIALAFMGFTGLVRD